MDSRLTEQEHNYIHQVMEMDEAERYTKKSLRPMKVIREKYTNVRDKECFCSMVRRKIWYKDFINWYEANS